MPEAFEKCIRNGGKVRTVSGPSKQHHLSKGQYKHICFIDGEMHSGEVKHKKQEK
jgi:hypothetical protein|tara:strand:+ start:2225 stop:2389 length:165 start_codon:yes stop_codon:yes gene_type:complete